MKEIKIENFTYFVEDDEFKKLYIEKYCNLDMYHDLNELEKLIGLINDICIDLHLNYYNKLLLLVYYRNH